MTQLPRSIVNFLINRYMGHLFAQKCALDDLTLGFISGETEARVGELELDTQFVNEKLEKLGVNLQLMEGFIGGLTLKLPLCNLLEKSCEFTVDELCLSFQPRNAGPVGAVNDIVSSMISSMATSRDLAQEFFAAEPETLQKDAGVESCEHLIAALMSRFILKVNNATIRLSTTSGDSEFITAVECNIDCARFVDEQLEANQDESKEQKTITSEPQSVFSINTLNKLLHLTGVSFHTDISSKAEDPVLSVSQAYTSMYQRRERERNKRKSSSSRSAEDYENDLLLSTQSTLEPFQSCYSHLSVADTHRSVASTSREEHSVHSDPVKFGQVTGDDNIIKFSIGNSAVSSNSENSAKNINIELKLQGLELFMNPSQIAIVRNIMDLLLMPKESLSNEDTPNDGNRPMNTEDFRNVEFQMQNAGQYRNDNGKSAHGNLAGGQWAGTETFQMTTRTRSETITEDDFYTVNLSSLGENRGSGGIRSSISSESSFETRTLCDGDKTDSTRLIANISSFLAIITHDDPWEASVVSQRMSSDPNAIADILEEAREQSEKFFAAVSAIRIKGVCDLTTLRKQFASLYDVDHLILTGWPLSVDCTMTKEPMNERTDLVITATQFDCCEYLTSPSIHGSSKSAHFDIFSFDTICESSAANLIFKMEVSTGNDPRNNIILSLGDCHTELDMSIVDRLSYLIAPTPFFSVKKKSPQYELHLNEDPFAPTTVVDQESRPLNFDLRTPGWTIDFRIPIADLRSTEAGNRLSYRVKNVHPETLKLRFEKVNLKLPKFNTEKLDIFWEMKLMCSSLTGSFEGDLSLLEIKKEEVRFLHASRESSIRENEDVCIELKYDRRNRSLTAGNGLSSAAIDPMCKSVWGSFFQSNEHKDGPFSQKVIMRDNETLTMVGERDELMDFGELCRGNSNLQLNINVPSLRVSLPSHMFFEILYNRLLNDLLLWAPCGPAFTKKPEEFPQDLLGPQFQPCKSTFINDSDSESESSTEDAFADNDGSPHDISVTFDVDMFDIVIGTTVSKSALGVSKGQIRGHLDNTQLFVVTGYHGDPNLTYFYTSSDSVGVFHQNLYEDVTPYNCDVNHPRFASRNATETVCIEPLDPECPFIHYLDDHKFALSMKIQCYEEKGVITKKDILMTSALQNSQYHVTLFSQVSDLWVQQLANFFNVTDYEVPGYVVPEVILQLRFNIRSTLISYAHNLIREDSDLRLKLAIGSCDLSSQIVGDQQTQRVQCILENSKLHVSNDRVVAQNSVGVHFEDDYHLPSSDSCNDFNSFIALLALGYFDIEVTLSSDLFDLRCKNDEIKAYLCSDSLSMLVIVVSEIFNSDIMKAGETDTPNPSEASPQSGDSFSCERTSGAKESRPDRQSTMTAAQEEMLRDHLSNAMLDVQTQNSCPKPDITNQNYAFFPEEESLEKYPPRTSTDCEEFCPIDEHPGHAVMGPSGDPYMRPFGGVQSGKRQPSVATRQERLYKPSEGRRQNAISLVPGSLPKVNINIQDITLRLFVFGGNDFGFDEPEPKTYAGDVRDRQKKRESREHFKGGEFRDETVMVEFLFQKISYRFELYGPEDDAVYASILSMHNMEIIDHLSVSKIKKMLYQDTGSDCHRRSNVPIFALRMFASKKYGAKVLMSALPIRMNIDQDSLEFLIDFFTEVSNSTVLPDEPSVQSDDQVVTHVQVKTNLSDADLQDELYVPEDNSYLFDENDITFSNDGNGELIDLNFGSPESPPSVDETCADDNLDDSSAPLDHIIKEFTFSPAVTISIDYVGKRVKTDNGAIMGLVIGMTNLHSTKLRLKELNTRKGVATLGKCFQFSAGEWLNDIRNNQLPNIFGSYGPLSSITQLAGGVRDLVVLPVDEFRKSDGHIVKGIQRGAGSFSVSAIAAFVDFTQGIASTVQGISEVAFNIVSPDYPNYDANRRRPPQSGRAKIPNDLRAGLSMAFDTVREGVYDTADVLQTAVQEDRASGQWYRRLIQQLVPTMLRPIVFGSRATVHVLGGLRSQLQPDQHMAEKRKWRD